MEATLEKLVNARMTENKGLDAVLLEIANDPTVSQELRLLACSTLTKVQL